MFRVRREYIQLKNENFIVLCVFVDAIRCDFRKPFSNNFVAVIVFC